MCTQLRNVAMVSSVTQTIYQFALILLHILLLFLRLGFCSDASSTTNRGTRPLR